MLAVAPVAAGDWENYLRAAARVSWKFCGEPVGIDVEILSDLPAAAGLSSSSALIVAFTLGLMRANGYNPGFEDLMQVLELVGTGALKVIVDRTFPLEDAAEALRQIESREVFGKLVVIP